MIGALRKEVQGHARCAYSSALMNVNFLVRNQNENLLGVYPLEIARLKPSLRTNVLGLILRCKIQLIHPAAACVCVRIIHIM